MGVRAYVGDWGSGKSMLMAEWLEAGRSRGMETATNMKYYNRTYGFRHPAEVLRLIADPARWAVPFRDMPFLRIAIDEAAVLFPCRGWSRWPAEMDLVVNEARKFKVELAVSMPNMSRVDVNLRLATSRVIVCDRLLKRTVDHPEYGPVDRPVLMRALHYHYADDKFGDRIRFEGGSRTWRSLQHAAALYDSFYAIDTVLEALQEAAAKLEGDNVGDSWGAAGVSRAENPVQPKRRSHHGLRSAQLADKST